jgi:hypothetical protein
MFTKKDKIKEFIEFSVQKPETQCMVFKNDKYAPIGVAVVMTYQYNLPEGIEIIYNKWYVECFDMAKRMGLPGTERHDNLVKGSGVNVYSKKSKNIFYGKQAESIINTCELNRDIESCIVSNYNQIIK